MRFVSMLSAPLTPVECRCYFDRSALGWNTTSVGSVGLSSAERQGWAPTQEKEPQTSNPALLILAWRDPKRPLNCFAEGSVGLIADRLRNVDEFSVAVMEQLDGLLHA